MRRNGMGKGVIWWLSLAVGTIAQLCLSPAIVSAQLSQASGTPTVYRLTFSANFRDAVTGQFLATPPFDVTDLDIAGVSPNSSVSSSGVSIPVSTYDQVKATLNCTVKLSGSVTFSGTRYSTTSAGGVLATDPLVVLTDPAVAGSYSLPALLCTPPSVTFTSPVFATPFSIGGTVTLTFNAADSLLLNGAPGSPALSAGPFSVTMTAQ